jgi:UDP-2,3-diacylglucosamine hydrolase
MTATSELPRIHLEVGACVIADLHLDVGPSGAEPRAFLELLARLRGRPRLVILGDLFDAWIGPAQLELAAAQRVVAALRALVDSGTQLEIVHGNRDFLLEQRFEAASGARVHPHGFVAELDGGARTLFVHGDEFCTLDRGYQRLKRVLRSRPLLWAAPRLPRSLALGVARRLRKASVNALAVKPSEEKQQQRAAVGEWAAASDCSVVVCGHAHKLRDEPVAAPGGAEARWIVLDAFGGRRDLLTVGKNGRIELGSSAAPGPVT